MRSDRGCSSSCSIRSSGSACINTAVDAGVDTVIEFGGGIGKGEGPDGKRPNLESIVKKSLKWREHQAQYLPAINAATIRATAEQLLAD